MMGMAETSDRYRRLAADMTETIQHVPDERWGDTSPCPDWTARDVVQHLVDTHGMFMRFVGRSLPAGPSVNDDPLAAWVSARDQMQADLDDPERIIDPSELERIWQDVDSFGDKMRVPGAFGEAIEPRPDASPQDRLLAYLGRQT
jgi:hypothetical protein